MFVLVLWANQGLLAKKKPPLHPVNLNTATSAELQEVPGIGPVTAEKILQMRKSYGAFKSVDDLRAIKGIGPARLDKMRRYLEVGKPPLGKQHSAQAASAPAKTSPAKSPAAKSVPSPKPDPPPAASEDEEP